MMFGMHAVTLRGSGCALAPQGDDDVRCGVILCCGVILRCALLRASKDDCDGVTP
jgi:hypothetical protein